MQGVGREMMPHHEQWLRESQAEVTRLRAELEAERAAHAETRAKLAAAMAGAGGRPPDADLRGLAAYVNNR